VKAAMADVAVAVVDGCDTLLAGLFGGDTDGCGSTRRRKMG
jgi:hypothetical protein